MSKLSFRARALDASKPMPIYMAEELPDLPDYSAINRAVPQMPSGMQKEEECEHHLQRAICAGLIIPTPEVTDVPFKDFYDKVYPANYKQPRQLIHMQPFTMEQDIPDYDMDSDDERWLQSQAQKLDLSPLKFEEMMDRLEKSSGQTVVTLNEAKALLKEDDDLIIAVFDYWLNKRLKTQHPLIPTVKTEHRVGTAVNNPYLAFRRRTEKMQTRKNRKNDEASYEKMLKLRRDLYRAVTLLELVKRREKIKREYVHLTVEVFEKRYQAKDFSGAIMAEASAVKPTQRPAFTPIFHNHYPNQGWSNKAVIKDEVIPRREKRQYKKRKHKSISHGRGLDAMGNASSDEEAAAPQLTPELEDAEDEGQFAFRRNKLCSYHMPLPQEGNWPWCSKEENGAADKRFRFTLTSLSNPKRCIGFARRRVGRGGRIILDRASTDHDDFWRTLDFSITEPKREEVTLASKKSITGEDGVDGGPWTEVVKSESDAGAARTSVSDFCSESDFSVKVECKKEPEDVEEDRLTGLLTNTVTFMPAIQVKEENDDEVEFLRSLRRDWLHFRPKTPPPDYEPPCHMLPVEDCCPFEPGGSVTPFSMEIQTLEAPSSTLLDSSTFLTDPFTFDLDIPVTDTRQHLHLRTPTSLNDTNTLIPSVSVNLNDSIALSDYDGELRTVGCSRFTLSEVDVASDAAPREPMTGTSFVPAASKLDNSSTLTSLKLLNSVNTASVGMTAITATATTATATTADGQRTRSNVDGQVSNTNGLLTQFGLDVAVPTNSRSRNNKLATYAYNSTGVAYPNTSPGTLSLHTSAHTLTLNSHSANILEIPMSSDADVVTTKLVNSHGSEGGPATSNNKTKTIVRKNNLIMEVT